MHFPVICQIKRLKALLNLMMDVNKEYDTTIENFRQEQFPALKGVTYLDHAGTTLVSRCQLEGHHTDLLTNLYGNPHSRCQSSQLTSDTIDQVRYRVLRHFNTTADEYSVIFTSGCTASLKIVAESFDFAGDEAKHWDEFQTDTNTFKRGIFCYLGDNHTSVQGMREIAFCRSGKVICVDFDKHNEKVQSKNVLFEHHNFSKGGNSLFAFPAQSNFSGRKYPLNWITRVKEGMMGFHEEDCGTWYTVLDAACFAGTSVLDLTSYSPDFVTISFYKMFGFPTGIGALLVHTHAAQVLKKRYFGGGTVNVSLARERFHIGRTSLSDRFEDGTVSFLDIIALRHGFNVLEQLAGGMTCISRHTFSLAQYIHHQLTSCCHGSGAPLAEVYCEGDFSDPESQGAIINFNLRRENGDYIGFAEVDKLAQLHNIHIRTGCFCNIGACQTFLGMSSEQIRKNFDAGHVCGDDLDLVDGRPTGSIRVSFGYMSTFSDVCKFLQFLVDCFLENSPEKRFYCPNSENLKSEDVHFTGIKGKTNDDISQTNTSLPILSQSESSVKSNGTVDQSCDRQAVQLSKDIRDIEMLEQKLEDSGKSTVVSGGISSQNLGRYLTDIFVYPIKSCSAFKVDCWPLSERGLLYDREWMIVSESGIALSQKRETNLCLLAPSLDLTTNTLQLNYPGMPSLRLSITEDQSTVETRETGLCTSKVCGDRVSSLDCGQEVSDWLSEALKRPGCRLVRHNPNDGRKSKMKKSADDGEHNVEKLSLANESQYLLINRASVIALHQQMTHRQVVTDTSAVEITGVSGEVPNIENLVMRFRANLVVECSEMFVEEQWQQVQIGNSVFTNQGACTRCQMVCVDQATGERSKEPLKTLAVWRGKKIPFGIHLVLKGSPSATMQLSVGEPLIIA